MRKIFFILLLIIGLLSIGIPAPAEIYCVKRWVEPANKIQHDIDYLSNKEKSAKTRQESSELNKKIRSLQKEQKRLLSRYQECEREFKKLCGHPKYKVYGSYEKCREYFRNMKSFTE